MKSAASGLCSRTLAGVRTCSTTGRPSTTTSVMSRSAATVGLVLLGGVRLTKCWHSRVLPTLHARRAGRQVVTVCVP